MSNLVDPHRQARDRAGGGEDAARDQGGPFLHGQALHLHLRLGEPGLYRLPQDHLLPAAALRADGLRVRRPSCATSATSRSTPSPAARPPAFPSPPGSPTGCSLPMHYVRKKPKGFGRNAQIEGEVVEGARTLLVEDLATDGGSKVNFCKALRDAGANVDHCFVLFYYDIFPQGREMMKRDRRQPALPRDLVGRARGRQGERAFRAAGAGRGRALPRTSRRNGRPRMAASRPSAKRRRPEAGAT